MTKIITTVPILNLQDDILSLRSDETLAREIQQKNIKNIEIRLYDGRTLSPEQRRKIYALFMDISRWSGYCPDETKPIMKVLFSIKTGEEMDFSLKDVDMSTAKEFINFLIEFCFSHNIGTKDTLLNQTDDIGKYLYQCLEYRKCAICNMPADIHHVDRVGRGFSRDNIVHVGMKAIALCRQHHTQAHQDEARLFNAYHVYGIKLDSYLCKKLGLKDK